MSLIVADFEVFHSDWVMVAINPIERSKTVIVNDSKQLKDFYEQHKNDIFIFYNGRQYDQYIFKAILLDFNPKDVNDWIIVKDMPGWKYSDLFRQVNINFFDIMTSFHGLKTLEGFMGNNIKESSVDFNLNRKLTAAEIQETIHYCTHDVEQTLKVFIQRKEEFDAHMSLLKEFKLPMNLVSKTKVQLSAVILGAVKQFRDDEFDIEYPNTLKLDKYKEIKQWYDNPLNRDYEKSLEIDVAGVPHIFAWGGLHGARANYMDTGYFLNVDVASYYPSLMLRYKWGSRNCPSLEKFKMIYETRLKLKREGKKKEQAPYKIVLNGTYGAMKDKFNNLYDPRQANNVCVGGQLLLLDLIEKLEDYCDLVQSNTDGILVKLRKKEDEEIVKNICHEWEERTGMVLEFDEFVKVIQRDVNNYIIVAADGSYKSKGAVVKKLNNLDYDRAIVNEAVVNYFVKGVPVEKTIMECDELVKFQQIVKVSSKYNHALHGDKILNDRTLRVFASTDERDGGVFKQKIGGNPEKFADSPVNCFIVNDNVNDMEIPKKLDKRFYVDLANKRISQFLGK